MENLKFQGKLVEVLDKQIERNGKSFTAEIVRRPPGVRTIVIKDDKVLLTKEYRHELNNYDYRLPGGKVYESIGEYKERIAKGVDILQEAQAASIKETLEECGISIINPQFIHKSICGASVTWDLYYFLATNFVNSEQKLEEMEEIEVEWVDKGVVKKMCLDGSISEERSALVLLRTLEG